MINESKVGLIDLMGATLRSLTTALKIGVSKNQSRQDAQIGHLVFVCLRLFYHIIHNNSIIFCEEGMKILGIPKVGDTYNQFHLEWLITEHNFVLTSFLR